MLCYDKAVMLKVYQ